ncbi:hypothetical protein RFI_25952, partial [Reticulomyxa filosa]
MNEIEEIEEKNERYEIDNLSQLFLKTQPLSWRDLIPVFINNSSLSREYPLIAQLLQCDEAIWYIQYLPAIASLVKHVHMEYSRQRLPDELRQIRLSEVLNQQHEIREWWNGVTCCWNYFVLECEQPKCGPEEVSIGQLCVIDSNADNTQLNIYKIIQLLETQNNQFLKTFQQFKHPHIQEIQEEEKKQNILQQPTLKCFFDINSDDILCFDELSLNEIIQRRSIPVSQYDQNDKSKCFDLASIENDIYHTFVHGRQPLIFIIPLFEYRSDFDIQDCIKNIETRYEDLRNAQFQYFWDKLNLSVASSVEKQRALEMLNDAIVYLYQNLDDLQIDMRLTQLFEKLQFEKKDCVLFSHRGYSNDKMDQLCVKHVGVLWYQLRNAFQSEYLDESSIDSYVLKMYQQSLTNEAKTQIKELIKKIPMGAMKDILEAWREIAYRQGQVTRNTEAEDFAHMLKKYVTNHDLKSFPPQLLKWKNCATAYEYAYREWKSQGQAPD